MSLVDNVSALATRIGQEAAKLPGIDERVTALEKKGPPKLETARTIQTNLASTSAASFDGTANITPGVTGVLPMTNGGTGNTTGTAADSAKWNGASKTVSSSSPSGGSDGDIWFQYV